MSRAVLCLIIFMSFPSIATTAAALTLQPPAAAPQKVGDDQNFPFLTPMPGMKLGSTWHDRGQLDYWDGSGMQEGYKHVKPAAGYVSKKYDAPDSLAVQQFMSTYEAALKQAGWEIDYKLEDTIFARYHKNGRDIYISISRSNNVEFDVAEVLPPFDVTLAQPAPTPKKAGDKEDFPFLKALPGMQLFATEISHDNMDYWSTDSNGDVQHYEPPGGYVTKRYNTPDGLSNYRFVQSYAPALTRLGWTITYKDLGNGSMFAHYNKNGRNIYLLMDTGEDVEFQVAEPPPEQNIVLKAPARTPEQFGDNDDFPYLTPLPGWKLDGTKHGSDPLLIHDKNDKVHYVGSSTIDKNYVGEKDIANDTFVNTYAKALIKAGWTMAWINKGEGFLYAHYDKNGRNIWAELDRYEHPSFHVADVGAGLKAALDKGCKVAVYGINFDFNKATLRPDSMPVLQQVLALFKDDPKLSVEIGGHTDNVGSNDYNQKLSEQRAAAVQSWLIANGVAASRLSSHGYGENQPLVPNDSDKNRARNRRVELKKPGCAE